MRKTRLILLVAISFIVLTCLYTDSLWMRTGRNKKKVRLPLEPSKIEVSQSSSEDEKDPVTAEHFDRTIQDMEKTANLSEACKSYGGHELVERLRKGKETVCHGRSSAIDWYSMRLTEENQEFGVLVMRNASFVKADGSLKYRINLDCHPEDSFKEKILVPHKEKATQVTNHLVQNIRLDAPSCREPMGNLIFVDSNDFYNWWWFLVHVQNHFLAMAALWTEIKQEPHTIVFMSKDDRLGSDATKERNDGHSGLREMYRRLFGRKDMPDIKSWSNIEDAFGCYSSIIIMRNAENGSPILKNVAHKRDQCYSPVIAALRFHMRSAIGLGQQADEADDKVCWVSRDEEYLPQYTTWQWARTIKNQSGLVAAMDLLAQKEGYRVVQLPFYPFNSGVPGSVQMKTAAGCKLIVGIHGAGLYVALAMENMSILELVVTKNSNRNAVNLKHLVGGCYRGQQLIHTTNKHADPKEVFAEVLQALKDCEGH